MYLSPYYTITLIIALSISLQFGYLFNDAYRYIPLRAIVICFVIVFFIKLLNNGSYKKNSLYLFFTGLISATFFLLVWTPRISSELVTKTYLNFIYIFFTLGLLFELLPRLNLAQINKSFFLGLLLSTCSLVIETFFRFLFPSLTVRNEDLINLISSRMNTSFSLIEFINDKTFYIYKYSSIMFYDSNYIGLFGLMLVVCLLFYREKISQSLVVNLLLTANIIIVFLSFSRSAIITLVFIISVYTLIKTMNKRKPIKTLFLTLFYFLVLLIISVIAFNYILVDESFKSKIDIINSIFYRSENYSFIELLFGFGFIEGGYIYSYKEGAYAHSLFPLLLGEIGLVGMVSYLFLFVFLCFKASWYGLLVAIAFFVPSFSLIDYWQIVYFWGLVYMYFIQKRQRELNA